MKRKSHKEAAQQILLSPRTTTQFEDPAPPAEGLWRLKGGHWNTPGVSWKLCSETGPSGGNFEVDLCSTRSTRV